METHTRLPSRPTMEVIATNCHLRDKRSESCECAPALLSSLWTDDVSQSHFARCDQRWPGGPSHRVLFAVALIGLFVLPTSDHL